MEFDESISILHQILYFWYPYKKMSHLLKQEGTSAKITNKYCTSKCHFPKGHPLLPHSDTHTCLGYSTERSALKHWSKNWASGVEYLVKLQVTHRDMLGENMSTLYLEGYHLWHSFFFWRFIGQSCKPLVPSTHLYNTWYIYINVHEHWEGDHRLSTKHPRFLHKWAE